MSFLAPIFFYVALGVAAGAVALHFIVTRQPTSSPLPTVRFVPASRVRVTTLAPVPEDVLLLLVRVFAILLIGAALARPVIVPHRRAVARIVLADVSRAGGAVESVRDSARALLGAGDVLVVFDSAARVVRRAAADSAASLGRTLREGRLSPALIAALRTASTIRDAADSIELVIVSPLRASEIDGATLAIRSLWPGRIRLVRVAGAGDSLAPPAGIAVRARADDAVALATSVAGFPTSDSVVRVIRDAATAGDSVWAASGRHTLVRWPVADAPPGWVARLHPDTVLAVVAGEAALVSPLERRWQPDSAARATRVSARWVDGVPAAIERDVGSGCIRDVGIAVPTQGDLVLRPAFGRFVRALLAPCATVAGGLAAESATLEALAGAGPLAAHDAVRPPDAVATPLVPWLLALALIMLLLELAVRRGSAPLGMDGADESEAGAAA